MKLNSNARYQHKMPTILLGSSLMQLPGSLAQEKENNPVVNARYRIGSSMNTKNKLKEIDKNILKFNFLSSVGVTIIALSLYFLVEEGSQSLVHGASLMIGIITMAKCFLKLQPLWQEKAILLKID